MRRQSSTYRVYCLFWQTVSHRNCCLFLPPSISLIIAIFWSKSIVVCLRLLLIFTHTIQTDAVTCTSPAACNISIPSPAVVSARRSHHHPPAGADQLHVHVHCSELSGPRPNISSYSSQCVSTADVTWLVHCIWCSRKQPASHTLSC